MKAQPIAWRAETVAKFWDYVAQREDLLGVYFASQMGRGVAEVLSRVTELTGRETLDYGCGRGHLVRHLLARGAIVSAVDTSPESVKAVDAAYARHEAWRGAKVGAARIPWPDESFDTVTCLETIEHLLPDQVTNVLGEIQRVLKPGGVAFFTTPNSEDLLESTVCCPNCLTEFHRWQHLRSWDAGGLERQLTTVGYEVLFCHALNFAVFQDQRRTSWKDYSPRFVVEFMRDLRCRFLDALDPQPFPHGRVFQRLVTNSRQIHLAGVARKSKE